MSYGTNGSVIGPDNVPTSSVASGVWSMGEIAEAVRDGIWPSPSTGWLLQMKNFDGDTTDPTPILGMNSVKMLSLSSSADKLFLWTNVQFGGSPLPYIIQCFITQSDGTVTLQPEYDSTYEMNTTGNMGMDGYVDSSDNVYGYWNESNFDGSSYVGSAWFKRNSSGTNQWVAGYRPGSSNGYSPFWYPYNSGGDKFIGSNPHSGVGGHYGKRTLIARVSDSNWPTVSATPSAQQAVYSTRESVDAFSTIDSYGGGTDGSYVYQHLSDYNTADGQGPTVIKWGISLSWQWGAKAAVGTGSGSLITQGGYTDSSGTTTMMGYQSTGDPYPLWFLQVNSSGSAASQRQWVHATTGNYFWPSGRAVDSSGNFYVTGYWQDTTDTGNWNGRPTIFKIDSSLNKVWIASCTVTKSGTTEQWLPYQFVLTTDGGMALAGYTSISGVQNETIVMKLGETTDSPAGQSGSVGDWSFSWADTTSLFAETTPSHTWSTTSYITNTSSPGYTWSTLSPTDGTWTSTNTVGGI